MQYDDIHDFLIAFDMDKYVDGIIMHSDHNPKERNLRDAEI